MSVKGNIVDNIVTALGTIKVINGYNETVRQIDTEKILSPEEVAADKFPYLSIVDGQENKSPADIDSTYCDLEVIITGYVRKESDATNMNTLRRNLENDIEKAIMTDPRRSLLAVDTRIVRISNDMGIFPDYGITEVRANVHYYHNRNNPSSQSNSL